MCTENKFTNNTERSAIVVRHFMPDYPGHALYQCYPWSPEELMEDDKYKSVLMSQSNISDTPISYQRRLVPHREDGGSARELGLVCAGL